MARSLTSAEYHICVPIDSILSQVEVSGKAGVVHPSYADNALLTR